MVELVPEIVDMQKLVSLKLHGTLMHGCKLFNECQFRMKVAFPANNLFPRIVQIAALARIEGKVSDNGNLDDVVEADQCHSTINVAGSLEVLLAMEKQVSGCTNPWLDLQGGAFQE